MSKVLFDHAQSTNDSQPLELYIYDMDAEQIWQQLEAQNEVLWDDCMKESCRLLALNEDKYTLKIKYPGENGEENEDETEESDNDQNGEDEEHSEEDEDDELGEEEEENDEEDEDDEDDDDSDNDTKRKLKVRIPIKIVPSVVDDQFFKLSEMEAFLEGEDKKEMDRMNGKVQNQDDSEDEGEEIDYFDSLSTDSEESDEDEEDEDDENVKNNEKHMKYADFFDEDDKQEQAGVTSKQQWRAERDQKNKRKKSEMKEDLGLEDSEGEEENLANEEGLEEDDEDQSDEELDNEGGEEKEEDHVEDGQERDNDIDKSEFGFRQDRLNKRIEELEETALDDKPWQLKGEITSSTRPKNSLLEEVLEFDSVARPAPLITDQTTECLEDLIKRRIKSKAWDDVQRKFKPVNDHQDFRKTLVLNQEKSKESLAQIYEKDYLDKVHKLNGVDVDAKPDEPAEHTDIRKAMKDLFIKLDALSNFHFTTKPVAAEPKIITNLPAIEMEEVAPVSVSDATLLAPEEVRARPIGDEIGKSERTDADQKRERRKKKLKQKLMKQREDKRVEDKEKLGIKVTTKEKQKQLMNQVTKSRNVIKVSVVIDSDNRIQMECAIVHSKKAFFFSFLFVIEQEKKAKNIWFVIPIMSDIDMTLNLCIQTQSCRLASIEY